MFFAYAPTDGVTSDDPRRAQKEPKKPKEPKRHKELQEVPRRSTAFSFVRKSLLIAMNKGAI